MTTIRWDLVRECFDALVELPAAEREGWLAARADVDDAVRREVRSLLAAHDTGGAQLDAMAAASLDGWLGDLSGDAAREAGMRIGPYHVRRRVGVGASAVVYEAEHEADPGTPVAVKVLREVWGTTVVARRFRS